jgi:hypothetical protein
MILFLFILLCMYIVVVVHAYIYMGVRGNELEKMVSIINSQAN